MVMVAVAPESYLIVAVFPSTFFYPEDFVPLVVGGSEDRIFQCEGAHGAAVNLESTVGEAQHVSSARAITEKGQEKNGEKKTREDFSWICTYSLAKWQS